MKKEKTTEKLHIWRFCPMGEHWVSIHPMHVPPGKTHPEGSITTRHAHCAKNPSGKDQLYPDEIIGMSNQYFKSLKNKPCPAGLGFKNGSSFDELIAGWVQYWNEVMQPTTPLDANTVKALIASESGFDPEKMANKKNQSSARGLMQITDGTRKVLSDEKGELNDHYITSSREQLMDPSTNICAGIRWLFQKQKLASSYLNREATWQEAVMNFKGKLKSKPDDLEAQKEKKIFKNFLDKLVKCEK